MEDKLFERPHPTPSSSKKDPRKADKDKSHTPSGKPQTTSFSCNSSDGHALNANDAMCYVV